MPGLLELFLSAFLAATLLPVSSELVLAWMASVSGADLLVLIVVATAGNTLGALLNWVLGRYCLRWRTHRWFPVSEPALERATAWMGRRGRWLLLFAWLPVVGDPLTFAAGALRVPLGGFTALVAIGKGARYVAVAVLVSTLAG